MNPSWKCIWVLPWLALLSDAQAGGFDGLFGRVGERIEKKIEDRIGRTGEKALDKTFDKADRAVGCAAGDEDCAPAERDETGADRAKDSVASARCVATDVACLRSAKAHGQRVDIVDEADLAVLRCKAQDRACLQRAKNTGKKVEITD